MATATSGLTPWVANHVCTHVAVMTTLELQIDEEFLTNLQFAILNAQFAIAGIRSEAEPPAASPVVAKGAPRRRNYRAVPYGPQALSA